MAAPASVRRKIGLLIALSLMGCGIQTRPLRDQQATSTRAGVVIVQRELEYQLASSHTVQVNNPFGELDVRVNPEPRLLMRAVVQKLQADADADLQVTLRNGVFQVGVRCVRALDRPCDRSALRVDLALAQPVGVALRARTGSERLRVKGLSGRVDLRSESGVILIDAPHQVRARTAADIFATLRQPAQANSQLHSLHGNITIALPTRGDYLLQAEAPSIYTALDSDGKRSSLQSSFERAYGKANYSVRVRAPQGSVELIGLVDAAKVP